MLIINILLLLWAALWIWRPLITINDAESSCRSHHPIIGMDPVHFGVVMILNLAGRPVHPPVGSALFVGCATGQNPD